MKTILEYINKGHIKQSSMLHLYYNEYRKEYYVRIYSENEFNNILKLSSCANVTDGMRNTVLNNIKQNNIVLIRPSYPLHHTLVYKKDEIEYNKAKDENELKVKQYKYIKDISINEFTAAYWNNLHK